LPKLPSFTRIYDDHFDLVYRVLCRYGVPEAQLEDALQEVFITVHDRIQSFEGRSSFRTWVYGVARRVARNHRTDSRLQVLEPQVLDQLALGLSHDDENALEQLDAARLLSQLLAQLAPERREIVVLVELEQLTVTDASEILGENPNTLQSRLRLAREDLAQALSRQRAEQAWRRQCATKTQR
jgi:RNA polymerase sigma-70 factor, ECF subfamily